MKNGLIVAAVGSNGNPSASLQFSTANSFNDGQWHHVAAVFDMTACTAKIYVDGNLQDLTPAAGSLGSAGTKLINFTQSNGLNASGTGPLTIAMDSGGGYWFSGVIDNPALYNIALSAAQERYVCGPELNNPPSVSITFPSAGLMAQPATLNLQVSAGDTDGSVVKVQYYDSGAEIAESGAPPFTASWTSPGNGTHLLTAKATDNRSATTVSTAVSVTFGADPNGNGIPDSWEEQYFGNDNEPGSTIGANGLTYLVDYLEGLNPNVTDISDQNGDLGLTVFTELEQ
jgi:hypothetical protein